MKGLATLIKLCQKRLDDLRRQLASLENQKSQLLLLTQKLKEELAQEMKLGSQRPDIGRYFGEYAKRMKLRQEEVAGEIASLDRQMEELRLKISEEFSELKKLEIARDNAKRRANEDEKHKETVQLDEIAGQQHRRRKLEDQ